MTSTQLGRPVGASGQQTRIRIINAAMRTVAETGYSKATIRSIARTADVTSASLYNYFPNRSALMKAAIAARADIALPRLHRAAQRCGGVIDRVEAVLDESGKLMHEYPDLAAFEWAIRAEGAGITPADGADVQFLELRHIIEGIVDDGLRGGEFKKSSDARAAVEVIYALLYGLTELAASASPRAYHTTLEAAKRLIRGTLFATG
ncbi:MAG: TetR/AcrR family transcriptional regulator [Actinomycetia bacterium]|nr:TetR/AcrR family transcriptional regulator [Actinomycetes bacterium]MCH9699918.1 TetR/AcrR family transcriptional regulator [Actinomycetes bacterium]MCH9762519.1 TetR/AcrR family transcriptional regulator [Actinomycetes bacterium]